MDDKPRSIRIWFENLAAMPADKRLPLQQLTPDEHIHGGLRIEIGGRLVPYLGFWGDDDVCFGEWLEQLWLVAQAFENSEQGCHTFDEGEQGQPAFIFERSGDRAYFTIGPSGLSEAVGDPNWQRVEFSPAEFIAEHARFREAFFDTLRGATSVADLWIQRHDPKNRNP